MQSFSEFLWEKGRVDSRHLPHYLRWVRMYREFAIRPTSGIASGIRDDAAAASGQGRQFTAFLSFLGRSYQDWQVRQARHALRLYWYCSRADQKRQAPSIHGPKQATLAISASWDTLEEKLVRLMRLRHLSYRTEKTYLSWVRRFRTFSLGREVGNLTEDDLMSWFWVFPSAKLSIDPFSGIVRCHHLYPLLCRRRSTKPSYAR